MKDKFIIITGPTASGKSDIAINIAKKIEGEIISADSQQVYSEMDIGTNKVMDTDYIYHHLINVVRPNEEFTVDDFKKKAEEIISILNSRFIMPIVTGGTGFYIDSLLFNMNYGQVKKDESIRNKLQNLKETYGNKFLYDKLKDVDEETAKIYHPNEVNRIIRSLEIYEITGEKPSAKRTGERVLNKNIDPILFFLNYKNRQILYNRINDRVNDMITLGLIDEFKYLMEKYKLNENSQSMAAIGYKEIFPYIRGEISLDEMISLIQRNTRRYAKRQITWMKRYLDYPFTREIIMDDLNKEDATIVIEDLIKGMYEF